MKKMGLLVVAASLSLSLAALAGEKSANGPAEGAKDKVRAKSSTRDRMDPAAQKKALTEQLARFKQEHQAVMGELQGIKQLAVKEKAGETAAALDKLIARHEQEYQKRIEPLQQRLKRLENGKKQGDGTPKASDEKTRKRTGGKKNNQ
jgi:hypothetical protein